jgi:uncharacterized protein YqeY
MNPLQQRVEEDFLEAYRASNQRVVEVLRLVKTALMNAEIEKRAKEKKREVELSEEEAREVIKRQVKSLEDAKELFRQGKRDDLVKQTEEEMEILKKYLPEELNEEEIKKIVQEKIQNLGKPGLEAFGRVMGEVMKELKGRASGEKVGKMVKELLVKENHS